MPGRIHVTAASSLSRPLWCIRARMPWREATNLRLIPCGLVGQLSLITGDLTDRFYDCTVYFYASFLRRVFLFWFRLAYCGRRWFMEQRVKSWNRKQRGYAPVRTFPLQVSSGSTQVIACRNPRDGRDSPLSSAHEKRKFMAMGLPAVFRVTVIQRSHRTRLTVKLERILQF